MARSLLLPAAYRERVRPEELRDRLQRRWLSLAPRLRSDVHELRTRLTVPPMSRGMPEHELRMLRIEHEGVVRRLRSRIDELEARLRDVDGDRQRLLDDLQTAANFRQRIYLALDEAGSPELPPRSCEIRIHELGGLLPSRGTKCQACGGTGEVEDDATGALGYVVKRPCGDCSSGTAKASPDELCADSVVTRDTLRRWLRELEVSLAAPDMRGVEVVCFELRKVLEPEEAAVHHVGDVIRRSAQVLRDIGGVEPLAEPGTGPGPITQEQGLKMSKLRRSLLAARAALLQANDIVCRHTTTPPGWRAFQEEHGLPTEGLVTDSIVDSRASPLAHAGWCNTGRPTAGPCDCPASRPANPEPPNTKRHAAVSLIERADGRLLCVWNRRYRGWALPGGMVEKGETVEEGLARELREETSLEIEIAVLVFQGVHGIKAVAQDRPGRASDVCVFRVTARGEPQAVEDGCPTMWLTREEFVASSPFGEFYKRVFTHVPPPTNAEPVQGSLVVPWWICRHCALVVRTARRYGNCAGRQTTAAEHEWIAAHFASLAESRSETALPLAMRTSPERCHAWLSTFAMLDDAPDHLAELLDRTVKETIEECAKLAHAEFEARDGNDGSAYCSNCGEAEHDPTCLVAMIRALGRDEKGEGSNG